MQTPSFYPQLCAALDLLGDTVNTQRSILGAFHPSAEKAWALAEQEQNIPLSKLVERVSIDGKPQYRSLPGLHLHPDIWNSLQKHHAKLQTGEPLDDKDYVNSNVLPKIGVVINESLLVLAMLYGSRLNADGTHKSTTPAISDDAIIAAMVYRTLKAPLKSSFLQKRDIVVDDALLRARFGDGVVDEIHTLQDALATFDSAMKTKDTKLLASIPPAQANSIVAIKSAELKEAIRIRAYHLFETIDAYPHVHDKDRGIIKRELRSKLGALKLTDDLSYAQVDLLKRSLAAMKTALQMPGIDNTMARIVQQRQIAPVEQVLDVKMKSTKLVGYEGEKGDLNGQALALFHMDLPVMKVKAEGRENEEDVLIKALVETSRYHHNGFRKGNNSIIGHLMQACTMGYKDLKANMRPLVATTLVLHDLVEDGGEDVAGYNQSLKLVSNRFSPLIAELVADLTDAAEKKASREYGAKKAAMTKASPHFIFADKDPRWLDPEKRLVPTNPDRPYSFTSAGPKVRDRRATMREMLQEPDYMTGHSAHSGWRLAWRLGSKGFVDDIVSHIATQLHKYDTGNPDFQLPVTDPKARKIYMNGLRRGLELEFNTDDMFMVQNLAILAGEFGLSKEQRTQLIDDFTNPKLSWQQLQEGVLKDLLNDENITKQVAAKKLASKDCSCLYTRDKEIRDDARLAQYRETYMARRELRIQSKIPELKVLTDPETTTMLDHYDRRMEAQKTVISVRRPGPGLK